MLLEEMIKYLEENVPRCSGVSIYHNKKYNTFNVKVHRHYAWTVEAMDCKTPEEAIRQILTRLEWMEMEERKRHGYGDRYGI